MMYTLTLHRLMFLSLLQLPSVRKISLELMNDPLAAGGVEAPVINICVV